MPYVLRTPETLAMFRRQAEALRNPATNAEDRGTAFFAVMSMEWATNKAILMSDIGMTEAESNELSQKYPKEFILGRDKLVASMLAKAK